MKEYLSREEDRTYLTVFFINFKDLFIVCRPPFVPWPWPCACCGGGLTPDGVREEG